MTENLTENKKYTPFHLVLRIEIRGNAPVITYRKYLNKEKFIVVTEKSLPVLFCEYIKSLIYQYKTTFKEDFELVAYEEKDLEA